MSGSWTKSTSGYTSQGDWIGSAASSTGQKCIVANTNNQNIYTSNDYGVSWNISSGSPPTSSYWSAVSITQSGDKMAACENNGSSYFNSIYLLDTTGSNLWTRIDSSGANPPGNETNPWTSLCFSMDGLYLSACQAPNLVWIYNISTETWTHVEDAIGNTISSNINGFVSAGFHNWIYTIYGASYTVTAITDQNSNLQPYGFTSISTNMDGSIIIACASGGENIYIGTYGTGGDPTKWNFITQSSAGSGNWNVVATGPDAVSIAACKGNTSEIPGEIWIGVKAYGSNSYTWTMQTDQDGNNLYADWKSISRSTDRNELTKFVAVVDKYYPYEKTGIWSFTSLLSASQSESPPPLVCFNKNTQILTDRGYVLIQNLKPGDLLHTGESGLVPIHTIGCKEIDNPGLTDRIKDQLYVCSREKYPELSEDLIITGCHSILVNSLSDEERKKTEELLGEIYITESKYRLPVCLDSRADIYKRNGLHTIYHIALENDNYYFNYGIYANGLLVETCSKRYLNEISGMNIIS